MKNNQIILWKNYLKINTNKVTIKMETATSIETALWNGILKNNKWKIIYKYDEFDAGIDFDFIIMEKAAEEILPGWANWFEGEIHCSKQRLNKIEKKVNQKFEKMEPEALAQKNIDFFRKESKKGSIFFRLYKIFKGNNQVV